MSKYSYEKPCVCYERLRNGGIHFSYRKDEGHYYEQLIEHTFYGYSFSQALKLFRETAGLTRKSIDLIEI